MHESVEEEPTTMKLFKSMSNRMVHILSIVTPVFVSMDTYMRIVLIQHTQWKI